MRVALVSSGLVPLPPTKGGAVEEYVYQLARHLRKLGLDAVAVDAKWNGDSMEIENINGAEVIKVPVKPPAISFKKSIIQEFLFGRAVVKTYQGFDILHANTVWTGFALAFYRDIKAYRLVYTCHNPLWPEDKVYFGERIVRFIEGHIMRASDLTIALNKTMYRAITEKAGVKADKVAIIPNGVDVNFFRPGLRGRDILNELKLKEQEYILFVGRVSPEKGVHLLLKAFKLVVKNVPHNMRLVIVGPLASSFASKDISSYAETVKKYAENELRGRVTFTGPVDRNVLRVLYSNACCLVLPSLVEAFPMVILEAMASGTPPVGSTAGGIPEVIVDGVNGLLFKKGNWRDLANKILMLIEDRVLRNRLAMNARKTVEENYDWPVIASRIKEAYAKLI